MLELRAATDLIRRSGAIRVRPTTPRCWSPILAAIVGGETKRDVRKARALLAEIA